MLTRLGQGLGVLLGLSESAVPRPVDELRAANTAARVHRRQYADRGVRRRAAYSGQDRRVPIKLRQAILAAEDDRFYRHGGVDYPGVLRAAWVDVTRSGEVQGASTITMQVARNFFLGREKTVRRKLLEVLLSQQGTQESIISL
jgi:membrane carboxypeptidase/penicillin-binding protein